MKVAYPGMGSYTNVINKIGDYLGWELVPLPPPSEKSIELGAKYMASELMCLPAKVTLGSMIVACEQGATDLLMFDSCLTDNNKVWSKRGVLKPSEVKVGDELLSLNEESRDIEWTTVERVFVREASEIIKFRLEKDKILEVTPEHPIYVKRDNKWQWVRAIDLVVGDVLYTAGKATRKVLMAGDSNPYRRYPHLRAKQSEFLKLLNPLFRPEVRAKHLLAAGTEETRLKKSAGNKGKKLICDFINNGVKVVRIERYIRDETVYNYLCSPNNNYYVNGVLTHNCGLCRLKTYWILQERALRKLGYDVTVHPVRLGW